MPNQRKYPIELRERATGPDIVSVGTAFQNGFVPDDELADAGEVEVVESAERREVRGGESRLGHVEVFRRVA